MNEIELEMTRLALVDAFQRINTEWDFFWVSGDLTDHLYAHGYRVNLTTSQIEALS